MPRGNQLRGDGGVFHLTHRCRNRAFLLKFARARDAYRARLREHLHQFDLALLDYCLTSNPVHLLVDAELNPRRGPWGCGRHRCRSVVETEGKKRT